MAFAYRTRHAKSLVWRSGGCEIDALRLVPDLRSGAIQAGLIVLQLQVCYETLAIGGLLDWLDYGLVIICWRRLYI